ncbi:MAG: hypothetical protein WCV84_05560 [Patescibacteria group bacterium]
MEQFAQGMRVQVIQRGEAVDEAIIKRVSTGGNPPTQEVEIESLNHSPGRRTQFALIDGGWRMLFNDPMAGGRCYSQRAPSCSFVKI